MGATVETIQISNETPHNFGAVTRWMVMYPRHAQSHTRTSPSTLCVWQHPQQRTSTLCVWQPPQQRTSILCVCGSLPSNVLVHCVCGSIPSNVLVHCVCGSIPSNVLVHCVCGSLPSNVLVHCVCGSIPSSDDSCHCRSEGQRASSHCVYVYGVESTGEWRGTDRLPPLPGETTGSGVLPCLVVALTRSPLMMHVLINPCIA